MTEPTIRQLAPVNDGDVVVVGFDGKDPDAATDMAQQIIDALRATDRGRCVVVVAPPEVTLEVVSEAAMLATGWLASARLAEFVLAAPDDPDADHNVVVCSRCRACAAVPLAPTLDVVVAAANRHACPETVDATAGT